MSKRRVLIADDSRLARMMLRSTLASARPNWEIVESGDAEEALAKAADQPMDLFLLDINMPGMNGLELGSKLKERLPDVPVALVTANVQDKMRDRAEAKGFIFLEKPITDEKVADLLDRVAID